MYLKSPPKNSAKKNKKDRNKLFYKYTKKKRDLQENLVI